MRPKRSANKQEISAATALSSVLQGSKSVSFKKNSRIFSQGTPSVDVIFISEGKIKLSTVSSRGKEAVVALLSAGDFLGEGAIAGRAVHVTSAIALTNCTLVRIPKRRIVDALHRDPQFSDTFVKFLLQRNARIEADLIDQLFNSSEKRLARTLLLLARFGKDSKTETVIPRISQEVLAEMVGTTRTRINFFMNRFRKLGFIRYNGELEVYDSLVDVLLHE